MLGPVGVFVDGATVALRARPTALLALLLQRANRPMSTAVLVDRLWPGTPPRTADSAMRVHLADVRRATRTTTDGPSRLATTRAGYVLTVEPDELDSARVEWAMEQAPGLPPDERAATLRCALQEWRGEPFQDQDDDAELIAARTYFQQRLVELRVAVADADLAIGRADRVAAETATWLVETPTSEAIARRSILALYATGAHVDALGAWRRFTESLLEDHGVDPTAEFRRLELDLLEHRIDLRPTPSQRLVTSAPRRSDDLVERDDVVAALVDPANRPQVTVLSAPAGYGKTALLRVVLEALDDVVSIAANRSAPLAPIADLLRAARSASITAVDIQAASGGDVVAGLAARVTAALGAAGIRHVLVDDADGLDTDSAAVLRRTIDATPAIHWVLAGRDAAVVFAALVAGNADSLRIRLEQLGVDGIAAVLQRYGGQAGADATTVTSVAQQTGGVPFLVVAAARHLAAGGAPDELPLVSVDHVRSLLDPAGSGDRMVLELAALSPAAELDVDVLATAAGVAAAEVIAAVERAIASGLLVDAADAPARFRHGLARDALVATMSTARRGDHHRRLARAEADASPVDVGRVAFHLRAGITRETRAEAARWTAREAAAAVRNGAVLTGAGLFLTAAEMGEQAALDVAEVLRWHLARSDALAAAGQVVEAQSVAQASADRARRAGAVEVFAEAAVRIAGPMIPTGDRRTRAELALVESLEWLPARPVGPRLVVLEALLRTTIGVEAPRVDRVRADALPLLLAASEDRSAPEDAARAELGLRSASWSAGLAARQRCDHSARAVALARRSTLPTLVLSARRVNAADLFECADARLAEALDDYEADALAVGATFHTWLARRIRVGWAQARGDADQRRAGDEATRLFAPTVDRTLNDRAELEVVLVDHILPGTLHELIGFVDDDRSPDVIATGGDEVEAVTALAFAAIRAAAGRPMPAETIGAVLRRAPRGPLFVGAAVLTGLAVEERPSAPRDAVLGAVIRALEPAIETMCVLDGGVVSLGPVAAHLGRCHELVGDGSRAEYCRRLADRIAGDFAPAWEGWRGGNGNERHG